MTERALTKPQIIAELTRSPHGALKDYVPVALRAASEDPDFFAHLIAWNHVKGQIRDAKAALPVIALRALATDAFAMSKIVENPVYGIYAENALAHLAALRPREFAQATEFARDIKAPTRLMRRLVERYLRELEATPGKFSGTALQHRAVLRELYSKWHVAPAGKAGSKGKPSDSQPNRTLFLDSEGGKFAIVRKLKDLPAEEAAALIVSQKIPFVVARGALGARAKDPDVVLALINRMSPTELVTNMRWLKRLGVESVPKLRSTLEAALGKAAVAKPARGGTLKTTKAAEVLEELGDDALAGKLRVLQEKQLTALGGIDGNWLVMGDRSGSMKASIEMAKEIAAVLARMVKGSVHLVYFDDSPQYYDVTGKTLEEIKKATAHVRDGGGTSFACAVQYLMDRKLMVDGIAIVSDGGENQPHGGFADRYQRYVKQFDIEPTVYWYRVEGSYSTHPHYRQSLEEEIQRFLATTKTAKIDVQTFDARKVDYHSLPNLVQTMRVGRYQLLDEVLAMELATLDEVLPKTKSLPVLARQLVTA